MWSARPEGTKVTEGAVVTVEAEIAIESQEGTRVRSIR